MQVKSRLHMHNHAEPNGRAYIVGEKQALRALGEALIKASKSVVGFETIDLFCKFQKFLDWLSDQ